MKAKRSLFCRLFHRPLWQATQDDWIDTHGFEWCPACMWRGPERRVK